MNELDVQKLANKAWLEKLFTAVARAAERRMLEFNAQDFANTTWAFATVKPVDVKLFSVLARAAELRVNEFHA